MSPSTTPASIDVSWPGSPTSTSARRRGAPPRPARAISDSETIEVSSTITTSCGSRLPRSWRNRLWLPGRQPSSRCKRRGAQARAARGPRSPRPARGLLVDRLLQPRRRLAGRRGQRHQRRRAGLSRRLLGQQRDDSRHRRRLAGAGAAGDHREAPAHGRSGGHALAIVRVAGEQPSAGRPGAPARPPPPLGPPRATAGRPPPRAPRASSGRDTGGCRAAAAARRRVHRVILADCDERAGPHGRRANRRPRARAAAERSTGSSDSTLAVSRIVARSTNTCPSRGAADGQGHGQPDRVVGAPRPAAPSRHGDVHVRRRQHADVVEGAQQPGGAEARARRPSHGRSADARSRASFRRGRH